MQNALSKRDITVDQIKDVCGFKHMSDSTIIRRITESGDDPKQYVEITFRVSETKFNAWPITLKSSFEAARTVKTGKPSYRLALLKE